MVLDSPDLRTAQRHDRTLDPAVVVRAEDGRGRRQRPDFVVVDTRSVEGRGFAVEQGMRAAHGIQRDLAREHDFAAVGVERHFAARRDDRQLQTPATTQYGLAGTGKRAHQIDLSPDFGRAIVCVQRRTAGHQTIVVLKAGTGRQDIARFRGIDHVDVDGRKEPLQCLGVDAAGGAYPAPGSISLPRQGIAFH